MSEIHLLIAAVRLRLATLRRDERGYTTETVLVTALLVACALAVLAIIVAAVTHKAGDISHNL